MPLNTFTNVVAAVIKKDDRILLSRRAPHLHQGNKWEFPGGKLEQGEKVEQALARELDEELGIHVQKFRPLITVRHQYPDKNVLLNVWQVDEFSGEPEGREGQLVAWIRQQDLRQYEFPEANLPVIEALELPTSIAITPISLTTNTAVMSRVRNQIHNHVLTLLRAPLLARGQYSVLAKSFVELTKNAGTELLLNSDAESVYQLDAAGLYYSPRRLMAAHERPIGKDKYFSAVCHTIKEIKQAKKLDVDFVFVSPVKAAGSQSHLEPLGWSGFASLRNKINCPVYALGGMKLDDLEQAWLNGAQGISSSSIWRL